MQMMEVLGRNGDEEGMIRDGVTGSKSGEIFFLSGKRGWDS